MTVDAGHLGLFPSQLIPSRGIMNPIESVTAAEYPYAVTPAVGYGASPVSGMAAAESCSPPIYASASAMKAVAESSDLTYNLPCTAAAVSRKRPREYSLIVPFFSIPTKTNQNGNGNGCGAFSFLGEDVSIHILKQQLEIDRFISQHMEMVRVEMEERRKRQSRRIIAAVEAGAMMGLRAKEEEIANIGKLNMALEERVKSLYIENQIWKDLAQTNEATANALRSNIQQVLTDATARQCHHNSVAVPVDDAVSCCGSNDAGDGDGLEVNSSNNCSMTGRNKNDGEGEGDGDRRRERRWWCRNCGKEEAGVLLLPCRHLCLCAVCGSTLHTCPICNAHKNASVHLNLSSS